MVYLDSATGLPLHKSSPPDAYVVLKVENVTQETQIVKQSSSPVFEKGFTFMVINPKTALLEMKVVDKKSGNELGEISYKIDKIKELPNLELKLQPFGLKKLGPDSALLCSMKLRVFGCKF